MDGADLAHVDMMLAESNRELVSRSNEMLSSAHAMRTDMSWRGDDIDQLAIDVEELVKQSRDAQDMVGNFEDRFRAHMNAHRRHMVLAIRFDQMLDRNLRKGRKRNVSKP